MVALATVAETKSALRIDDGDLIDDSAISSLIDVASELVVAYLKAEVIEEVDEDVSPAVTTVIMDLTASPPIIPERVRHAAIMLVGYLYRAPDVNPGNEWTHGNLPMPVMSLLYQLRDPALQ